jgi:pimeloyl-ACP methyl ester carboxylesterase
MQVARKQSPLGAVSQMWAVWTHRVKPGRLRTISEVIPGILIVTGDEDHLVRPENSRYLHEQLPGSQYEVFKGFGHGLPGQDPPRFNALLEAFIVRVNAKLAGSSN